MPDFAVTLVDIGGTKELILVVGIDNKGNLLEEKIYAHHEVKTPVGDVKGFYDRTAKAILDTWEKVWKKIRILPLVCVGTPGRLVLGTIQPASAANLGSHKHEFDGVNPGMELESRLRVKIYAGNDAIAQMCHGLNMLRRRQEMREKLKGRKVCYIGPGTGTGGGFCRVKGDGNFEVYTDGHIYDIMIPGYDGRLEFPFTVDGEKLLATLPHEKTKLEDLLSGRAIRQIACAMEREVILKGDKPLFLPALPDCTPMRREELLSLVDHDNGESPVTARFLRETFLHADKEDKVIERAVPTAKRIFEFEGLILGRLVECIYTGNIKKFLKEAEWSSTDKRKVKGTKDYLIGGSVGTRGLGGKIIQETALRYLKEKFLKVHFNFYPLSGETANAGAFGTFYFADRKEIVRLMKEK